MIVAQKCVPLIIPGHIGRKQRVHSMFSKPIAFTKKLQKSLQIVATSEHWWEDEEEFDALTDALRKKVIIVITPGGNDAAATEIDTLRSSLAPLEFNASFCGSEQIDYATKLWDGRDKPPMFLKMRRRVTLDAVDRVSQFLEEALQQNWRLDLDAGLGLEEPPAENFLVVCSGQVAESLLQACCGNSGAGASSSSQVAVVTVEGTKAGDPANWKALSKKVFYVSAESIHKVV